MKAAWFTKATTEISNSNSTATKYINPLETSTRKEINDVNFIAKRGYKQSITEQNKV